MRGVKRKLIDGREIVFVRFPVESTIKEILEKLNWAKSYDVVEMYDEMVVKCFIKPQYLKHFIKDNQKNRLFFKFFKMDDNYVFDVSGCVCD